MAEPVISPAPRRKWRLPAALLLAGLVLLISLWLAPALLRAASEYLSQSQQPVGTLSNGVRMAAAGFFLLVVAAGWLDQRRQVRQDLAGAPPGKMPQAWGLGFLAAALLMAGAILYANPRGMYPTSFYTPRWLLVRPLKMDAYQALPAAPDVVILGTSRTFTISPADLQARLGYTAFNASMEGMRMAEMPAWVRFVAQERPPGPAVLLIEAAPYAADDLITERLPARLLPYLSPTQAASFIYIRYTSLFNLDHLAESAYLMLRQPEESVDWAFLADGTGVLPLSSQAGLEAGLDRVIADTPAHCQTPSPLAIRYHQQVADMAARYQMAVVFIIPPYHPLYYNAWMAPGSDFAACQTQAVAFLQAITQAHDYIFLLNYTDPASIDGLDASAEGYYDHQHMTQANAARLIEAAAATLQQAYQVAQEQRTR